jgi:uncharacterized damage-inducible protein DinB
MKRPDPADYAPYYARYIDMVPEDDVVSALESQSGETQRLLSRLDEAQASFRYEPEKWSVKQVIGHVTDAERIFGSRMHAISRGEQQSLPGFDEQAYVENGEFDSWKLGDLAEFYALTRRANIVMLRNLSDVAWDRRGTANNVPVSLRALAFMTVGHERHHLKVLREKYRVG